MNWRKFVFRSFLNTLSNVIELQLHGFSDDSPKGYEAVAYLRLQDRVGTMVIHLLMAKRVAPTKRVILPRLKLVTAYILSKLVQFVLKSSKTNMSQHIC